jgi:hypothetical protein
MSTLYKSALDGRWFPKLFIIEVWTGMGGWGEKTTALYESAPEGILLVMPANKRAIYKIILKLNEKLSN